MVKRCFPLEHAKNPGPVRRWFMPAVSAAHNRVESIPRMTNDGRVFLALHGVATLPKRTFLLLNNQDPWSLIFQIQQSLGISKEVRVDCQLFAGRVQLHRFLRILRCVLLERMRNAAESLRGDVGMWEMGNLRGNWGYLDLHPIKLIEIPTGWYWLLYFCMILGQSREKGCCRLAGNGL